MLRTRPHSNFAPHALHRNISSQYQVGRRNQQGKSYSFGPSPSPHFRSFLFSHRVGGIHTSGLRNIHSYSNRLPCFCNFGGLPSTSKTTRPQSSTTSLGQVRSSFGYRFTVHIGLKRVTNRHSDLAFISDLMHEAACILQRTKIKPIRRADAEWSPLGVI